MRRLEALGTVQRLRDGAQNYVTPEEQCVCAPQPERIRGILKTAESSLNVDIITLQFIYLLEIKRQNYCLNFRVDGQMLK